ncbi:peptidoglycan DD-metalloendopeptidase family protein [Kallotenue papyrolyticum]|uniref:peptidoglycan DD-metalloendopeptidase family protein n=1 Tax=Kallotenue papyrolyticum TaxID=1325125 RepID=UPI000478669E|nr:peptidoglycan DD-metalloendopeptidase family protein [Kallotenue papyrolyticum]
MRVLTLLLGLLLGLQTLLVAPVPALAQTAELNVQRFLERQPGPLKSYRVGERTAAQVIAAYSGYYNLDARIILTLLELVPRLLSTPNPAAERLEQPFGAAGPRGFQAQIEWAVRELRAGFGPYDAPPLLRFSDGTTVTLDLRDEPSLIAVQRFLALGRTQPEWRGLAQAYVPLYRQLWGDQPELPTPTPAATRPFLLQPWPMGIEVIHSSYFDHVYPTVDRGPDGNTFVVDYLGRGNRSYNTHDGHDYYFPAQPIGTPILAAAPGMAYAYTARGNGVVIRHGGAFAGYETVYWHLDQFSTIFAGTIDSGVGVPVAAGTVLGTSGKSGFTDGGAHLHFEVRHNGRQVDPYGWYGPGPDPCAAWSAGCAASVWLWHDSLIGTYDFTPPDAPAPPDREAPQGSLAISPDEQLALLAHFDGSLVATFGQGFPQFNGSAPQFDAGVFGQALRLSPALELTYPISGNLDLDQGTLALWVRLPAGYPPNSTGRHYLFAASANPEAGPFYTDTLALRREQSETGPLWNFWSVDHSGVAHSLTVSDTLTPERWHHLAVTWNRATGSKALFIDGQRVAAAEGVGLPVTLGERLRLGAFVAHFGVLDAAVDQLAIWRRVLDGRELRRLAAQRDIYSDRSGPLAAAVVVTERTVVLDANALDAQGGIVAVQLRRDDEPWSAPMPYYDAFRWTITGTVGLHTFAIRYRDRADNATVVTTTVELAPPLQGAAELRAIQEQTALLALHVDGLEQPPPAWLPADELAPGAFQMQIGIDPALRDAAWEPFAPLRMWRWDSTGPRPLYVRFRDERGRLSPIYRVTPEAR